MEGVARMVLRVFLIFIALYGVMLAVHCSEDSSVNDDDINTGDTIRVPTDKATIQEAIDAATNGQVILVAAGIYTGPGNRDLNTRGKEISILSVAGPTETVIDCQGTVDTIHQAFYIYQRETFRTVIEGFTIRGGYGPNGGGMGFRSSSPTIRNCIFYGNEAYASGGAVHCKSASPTFINCTFYGNGAPAGGAVFVIAGASPHFANCIISYSTEGEAVYCSENTSQPTLGCSDIYGNAGGDWIDCISEQAAVDGNLSEEPLFCDQGGGDFHLQEISPCSPANNGCQVTIGALPVGCAK